MKALKLGKALLTFSALCLTNTTVFANNTNNGIYWNKNDKEVKITVDWCREQTDGANCPVLLANSGSIESLRITEEDSVFIHVTNFNYVLYDVSFDVTETEIKAYTFLAGLWSEIFGLDLGGLAGVSGTVSGAAGAPEIGAWWKQIDSQKSELRGIISQYDTTTLYLDSSHNTLSADINRASNAIKELRNSRTSAAREVASNGEFVPLFQLVEKEHDEMISLWSSFISRAKKAKDGHVKRIGKKAMGNIVEVVLQSNVRPDAPVTNSVKLSSIDVNYPVQSKYPLIFHVGATFANLDDVDFQAVRSASGQDLFLKTKDEDFVQNLSAFVSTPIDGKPLNTAKWFATLGTDFTDIGDNLYGGISYEVTDNWLLSAGVAWGIVQEASQAVMDMPAGNADAMGDGMDSSGRTLFEIVEEDRHTTWFVSVSYKIF